MIIDGGYPKAEHERCALMKEISNKCVAEGFRVEQTGLIELPNPLLEHSPILLGKFLEKIVGVAKDTINNCKVKGICSSSENYNPHVVHYGEDKYYLSILR